MSNTKNPNKHIRKEIYDRIHNADVDGVTFKCFDSRVPSSDEKNYFLINTQLNQPNRTKCGRGWINSTEIQVICITKTNEGSRVLMDNAVDEVLEELEEFTFPTSVGMKVNLDELSIDNEIIEKKHGEITYTKIIRLQTTIN